MTENPITAEGVEEDSFGKNAEEMHKQGESFANNGEEVHKQETATEEMYARKKRLAVITMDKQMRHHALMK